MKRTILILVLLTTVAAMGQEINHAPTAEQCKADVAVWKEEKREAIVALPFDTEQRVIYIQKCEKVLFDPHTPSDVWLNAFAMKRAYEEHLLDRLKKFINRNGLTRQFYEQDAKGAR